MLTTLHQQPQRPRLRVNDENMPPPALPGKTLHQRTKSTPALSSLVQAAAVKATQKKILGEANANMRLARPAKDDSEIGKASPGKLAQLDTKPIPVANLARPAARPLATKTTHTVQPQAEVEPAVKRVAAKKSMKVLKEVQPPQPVDQNVKKTISMAINSHALSAPPREVPLASTILQPAVQRPAQSILPMQRQEVRKTESVPLRDEAGARPVQKLASVPSVPAEVLPPGFTSHQEYLSYLNYHQYQLQQQELNAVPLANGVQAQYLDFQPLPEQYYDLDEEDYGYEDGYTTARSFGMQGESTGGVTTILAPKVSDKVKDEIRAAKEFVEATRPAEDIEDEQWDTSMVAEYGEEIFQYMHDLEGRMAPNPRYMEQQTEIQWSMRAVLMDWVIQVHQRFNLLPETLFLTVNYIDRFLSCKIVSLGKLQLVGATAIFVAAKYEEVQCPTISEIIYMVDGGYSADELLKAERFMLSMLQFELGWPGPMSFLRRISKADDYDLETRTLAKYFLEVTVMDERFVGCTPSFLAAGAHCMARLMIHNDEWSKAHVYYSNYTWSQLRQLLSAILECCEDPHKHHSAVYDKYTDKRYKRASLFVATKLSAGFRLPIDNPPAQPLTPHSGMASMSSIMR